MSAVLTSADLVGVLRPDFELLFPPQANMEQFPSLWFAARIPYDVANRNNVQWRAIGRLKPGVGIPQAQAEAETIAEKIRQENTIARRWSVFPTRADEAAFGQRS